MEIKYIFGKNLGLLRTAKNMTQEAFAEKLDISPKTLSAIENGRRFVSAEMLDRIITHLDIKPTLLFESDLTPKTLEINDKHKIMDNFEKRVDKFITDFKKDITKL